MLLKSGEGSKYPVSFFCLDEGGGGGRAGAHRLCLLFRTGSPSERRQRGGFERMSGENIPKLNRTVRPQQAPQGDPRQHSGLRRILKKQAVLLLPR